MVSTTAYATYEGIEISPKGPDGKRYWHLSWTAGAFNDTDISFGRLGGAGTPLVGVCGPLKEFVRPEGRLVITHIEFFSNIDSMGATVMPMIELSGVLNTLPFWVGPKATFTSSPDSYQIQCQVPISVAKSQVMRVYSTGYIATTTLAVHLEGWLDG